MVGLELVADRESRAPFPRSAHVTEGVARAALEAGVIVYTSTGNADGVDGDVIMLGPPFVITDAELDRLVDGVTKGVISGVARQVSAT